MRLRIRLLVALLLFSASALAQRGFEGEIVYDVQSERQSGTLTLFLSPKGIRAEFKGQSAFTIIVPRDSLVAYRLNDKAKTYQELDLAEQKRLSASLGKLETFNAERAGDETLLGATCRRFKLKSPKREIEVWTATSLVDSVMLARLADAGALVGLSPNAMETMRKERLDGLPLKIVATEEATSIRVEAKQLKRKPLKASLFELPKSHRAEDNSSELK
ncbi:MAG: DUF4412 domain-containing protein [Chloroherpetonaceae bacterium]|nr:DUF4412 domain-containing protein [Chloroherpetonaceae bacterium]MDW8437029.1 DUF4412 domain-containing protein [Chloroherpetonaceae bacterium]